MRKLSQRFLKKKPMEFGSWTTRELLISSVAGCAGRLPSPVCSPFSAAAGRECFPAHYGADFPRRQGDPVLGFVRRGDALPILLRHIESSDNVQQRKRSVWRAATADVAMWRSRKMEERLAADTKENIDTQLLTEVSSRVIG